MKPKIIKRRKIDQSQKEKPIRKNFVEKAGDWNCPNCANINLLLDNYAIDVNYQNKKLF